MTYHFENDEFPGFNSFDQILNTLDAYIPEYALKLLSLYISISKKLKKSQIFEFFSKSEKRNPFDQIVIYISSLASATSVGLFRALQNHENPKF